MDRFQKGLDWIVKIASLLVTAPATWSVAAKLFADIDVPFVFLVMRLAAVVLVEGVMLSNWLLLEYNRNASAEQKARYAITALAMYIALLIIAWDHEGPTGLVFRFALLAALLGSGWDTYVHTWEKATARADRDIDSAPKVRRHRRKAQITIAKLEVDYWQKSEQERLGLESARTLQGLQMEHRRILEGMKHSELRTAGAVESWSASAPPKTLTRGAKRPTKAQRRGIGLQLLEQSPDVSGPEFVTQLGNLLVEQFGVSVSESTAYEDFRALRNGRSG